MALAHIEIKTNKTELLHLNVWKSVQGNVSASKPVCLLTLFVPQISNLYALILLSS